MNNLSINSCEMAQGLVGGVWPKGDLADKAICEAIGNSEGIFTDYAAAKHGCGTQRPARLDQRGCRRRLCRRQSRRAAQLHLACPQAERLLQPRRHLRPRTRRICDDAHRHGDLRAAQGRRAGQVRAFRRRCLLDAGDRAARRDAGPVGAGVPVRRARPVPQPDFPADEPVEREGHPAARCRGSSAAWSRPSAATPRSATRRRNCSRWHRCRSTRSSPCRRPMGAGWQPTTATRWPRSPASISSMPFSSASPPRPDARWRVSSRADEAKLAIWRAQVAEVRSSLAQRQATGQARVSAIMQIIEKTAMIENMLAASMSPSMAAALDWSRGMQSRSIVP